MFLSLKHCFSSSYNRCYEPRRLRCLLLCCQSTANKTRKRRSNPENKFLGFTKYRRKYECRSRSRQRDDNCWRLSKSIDDIGGRALKVNKAVAMSGPFCDWLSTESGALGLRLVQKRNYVDEIGILISKVYSLEVIKCHRTIRLRINVCSTRFIRLNDFLIGDFLRRLGTVA